MYHSNKTEENIDGNGEQISLLAKSLLNLTILIDELGMYHKTKNEMYDRFAGRHKNLLGYDNRSAHSVGDNK